MKIKLAKSYFKNTIDFIPDNNNPQIRGNRLKIESIKYLISKGYDVLGFKASLQCNMGYNQEDMVKAMMFATKEKIDISEIKEYINSLKEDKK